MRSTGGDRRGVQKGRASGQECGESQAQGASWTEMGGRGIWIALGRGWIGGGAGNRAGCMLAGENAMGEAPR